MARAASEAACKFRTLGFYRRGSLEPRTITPHTGLEWSEAYTLCGKLGATGNCFVDLVRELNYVCTYW